MGDGMSDAAREEREGKAFDNALFQLVEAIEEADDMAFGPPNYFVDELARALRRFGIVVTRGEEAFAAGRAAERAEIVAYLDEAAEIAGRIGLTATREAFRGAVIFIQRGAHLAGQHHNETEGEGKDG